MQKTFGCVVYGDLNGLVLPTVAPDNPTTNKVSVGDLVLVAVQIHSVSDEIKVAQVTPPAGFTRIGRYVQGEALSSAYFHDAVEFYLGRAPDPVPESWTWNVANITDFSSVAGTLFGCAFSGVASYHIGAVAGFDSVTAAPSAPLVTQFDSEKLVVMAIADYMAYVASGGASTSVNPGASGLSWTGDTIYRQVYDMVNGVYNPDYNGYHGVLGEGLRYANTEDTAALTISGAAQTGASIILGMVSSGTCAQEGMVAALPESLNLTPGGSRQLQAATYGLTDPSVTWSIQEGEAGGTITSAGVYTAPQTAGVYHVIATSVENPSKSGACNVIVTASGTSTIRIQLRRKGSV